MSKCQIIINISFNNTLIYILLIKQKNTYFIQNVTETLNDVTKLTYRLASKLRSKIEPNKA